MNVHRAAQFVADLADAGIREFCVCPGGRNAPLVVVLHRARGLTIRTFFEERAAAFFALGRVKATAAPVAVVTTSGTAAAELLPAAVEAYYAGLPLVLVTADRPPAYRGTGSPQTIEQPGLFGAYAGTIFDGTTDDDRVTLDEWSGRQPVHLNICFDEPLIDDTIPAIDVTAPRARRRHAVTDPAPLAAFLRAARRPLVLVGPLEREERDDVAAHLAAFGAPVYAEAASGLREDDRLTACRLTGGEGTLTTIDADAVLRIGGVPTVRFWRDLEVTRTALPVCSLASAPFPGLSRGTLLTGRPGTLLGSVDLATVRLDQEWCASVRAPDRERASAIAGLWARHPAAEASLLRRLSAAVPAGSLVYLGNSLPIREWDLAAIREPRDWDMAANRGANGIDGQLSTFFGMCAPGREHWAVVGDLTALYDLAAPWILGQLDTGPIRIVVVNNGGGQIFARLSPHPELRNPHRIGFEHAAAFWGLDYARWADVPDHPALPERCLIELTPDAAATAGFWADYDAIA